MEAKATYSGQGQYYGSSVKSGFPDVVGNYKHLVIYIELKAKGKRATLRDKQRSFLNKAISQGAFACATDSIEHLKELFEVWIKTKELKDRISLLENDMPKEPTRRDDGDLFNE